MEIKATSRLLGLVSGLKFAPQTHPIRVKCKTNCVFVIRVFPRLAWIYFLLWLIAYIVCVVCCDWLTDLISILHRETFSKPLTNREQTQFRKLRVTISTWVVNFFCYFQLGEISFLHMWSLPMHKLGTKKFMTRQQQQETAPFVVGETVINHFSDISI